VDKKRGPFLKGPLIRKEVCEEPAYHRQGRCLGCFFLGIVNKLLKCLTLLNQFALSSAYLNMDFWISFPIVTDKITHLWSLPFRPAFEDNIYILNYAYTKTQNIEMSRKKFKFTENFYAVISICYNFNKK
jgi:hypothetical protein